MTGFVDFSEFTFVSFIEVKFWKNLARGGLVDGR
jgi:hypothetical protein